MNKFAIFVLVACMAAVVVSILICYFIIDEILHAFYSMSALFQRFAMLPKKPIILATKISIIRAFSPKLPI